MHIDWNNEFWYLTESTNGPQLGCQEAREPNKTLIPELPSTPVLCPTTWSQWSKRLLLGLATAGDSVQDSQHDWGKANIVIIPSWLGAIINRNPFLGVYAISYTSNLGGWWLYGDYCIGWIRHFGPGTCWSKQHDPPSAVLCPTRAPLNAIQDLKHENMPRTFRDFWGNNNEYNHGNNFHRLGHNPPKPWLYI